jgi:alkyldihydroxyacetonephosphate synthase
MNQVIWVNKEDGLAHVEAGITGRELIGHMEKLGLTIGHEPDSYEFSTLGGWIATKASGMKQNRYGNIEDIVKEVTVLGPNGIISNMHPVDKVSHGRVSAGVDFKSIMLGSEGGLGIIASAVIKVWPIADNIS